MKVIEDFRKSIFTLDWPLIRLASFSGVCDKRPNSSFICQTLI